MESEMLGRAPRADVTDATSEAEVKRT